MPERKRVLIVDDEGLNAMALGAHLEGLGYQVVGYSATGEDAVRAAAAEAPDLIFMDVRLAGRMDGLEAAALINEARPIPIVIISGYTEKALAGRDSAFKPAAFLSKPFDLDDIEALLRSIAIPGP
jgi:CheY-like chemotaxis protein